MLTYSQRAAAKAVDATRRRMLLTKTPRTAIAEESGTNRQTVSKYLEHSNDMTLGMFIAASRLTGADPIETLSNAIEATGREKE